MGKVSTRNVPGTMAISTAAIACSDAERSSSLSDSTFAPYATDKLKDAAKLSSRNTFRESETGQ